MSMRLWEGFHNRTLRVNTFVEDLAIPVRKECVRLNTLEIISSCLKDMRSYMSNEAD